jgi:hypothetical protein
VNLIESFFIEDGYVIVLEKLGLSLYNLLIKKNKKGTVNINISIIIYRIEFKRIIRNRWIDNKSSELIT